MCLPRDPLLVLKKDDVRTAEWVGKDTRVLGNLAAVVLAPAELGSQKRERHRPLRGEQQEHAGDLQHPPLRLRLRQKAKERRSDRADRR